MANKFWTFLQSLHFRSPYTNFQRWKFLVMQTLSTTRAQRRRSRTTLGLNRIVKNTRWVGVFNLAYRIIEEITFYYHEIRLAVDAYRNPAIPCRTAAAVKGTKKSYGFTTLLIVMYRHVLSCIKFIIYVSGIYSEIHAATHIAVH